MLRERPRARTVIEATTGGESVARCLEGLGHEVIVADLNFAPMYATRTRKLKTDRRDARALADTCLLAAYHPAHRLSDPQRHVRGRLTGRDAVVPTWTRYISLICALLRQQGYRVPSGSAEAFVQRVATVACPHSSWRPRRSSISVLKPRIRLALLLAFTTSKPGLTQ